MSDPIKVFDIVRLSNLDEMIVTAIKPNRPTNPFVGILVNGKGTEYKFGPRHRPAVIGRALSDHPALVARQARIAKKLGVTPVDNGAKAAITHLLDAVDADDFVKAKILASVIRSMNL